MYDFFFVTVPICTYLTIYKLHKRKFKTCCLHFPFLNSLPHFLPLQARQYFFYIFLLLLWLFKFVHSQQLESVYAVFDFAVSLLVAAVVVVPTLAVVLHFLLLCAIPFSTQLNRASRYLNFSSALTLSALHHLFLLMLLLPLRLLLCLLLQIFYQYALECTLLL